MGGNNLESTNAKRSREDKNLQRNILGGKAAKILFDYEEKSELQEKGKKMPK